MRDDITKAFPHSLIAEKSTLSSMLQCGAQFIGLAVESGITPAHYYEPGRSILFEFLCDRVDQGLPTDMDTMFQTLIDIGQMDRIGGPSAFSDIYTYAPTTGNFDFHIKALKDKWAMRQLLNFCTETENEVWDSPAEVDEVLDCAEKRIMAIREGREALAEESIKASVAWVVEDFRDRLNGKNDIQGLSSGFEDLDRMTGGLKGGEVYIVAARPSMGKTSFMMNIAEHIAIDLGIAGMIFSCEMQRRQLTQRLVYSRAKYDWNELNRGVKPAKGDLQRIRTAAMQVSSAPLFIDDEPAITISKLRAKARRKKREKDIQFIGIDYLQLMRSHTKQAINSREREISEISAGVKALAKELGIPIILLAQLNRDSEKRGGAKNPGIPRMSDLRESGSIEQDADMVGLLYRPEYFLEGEQKAECDGKAKLIVAKNRNGPTGDVPLTFIKQLSRFESGQPFVPSQQEPAEGWIRA